MNNNAIEITGLLKSFRNKIALNNLNLIVETENVAGIIGPDGAGKTTLFRILSTLLLPDNGKAKIFGFDTEKDYKKLRKIIGYMPERFSLYQDLTVEENLNFFANIFGTTVATNYNLIKDIYTKLEPFKNRKAGKLSGGMKQKLALCCSLIHRPQILFLDEPTTGVDPVSRSEFWDILKKLKNEGITVIVATPYMDEAKRCEKIALMHSGKILEYETHHHITKNFQGLIYSVKSDDNYRLLNDIRRFDKVKSVYPFGESLHFIPSSFILDINMFEKYLKDLSHSNLEIKQIEPEIEDCFISFVEKENESRHT